VTGLVEQDTKGNQKNTSVTLVLESRTGASGWVIEKTVTITGKISGEYLEAHLIDAPDIKPFDIRVRRITPTAAAICCPTALSGIATVKSPTTT
jgi:predicted phage tail protein